MFECLYVLLVLFLIITIRKTKGRPKTAAQNLDTLPREVFSDINLARERSLGNGFLLIRLVAGELISKAFAPGGES